MNGSENPNMRASGELPGSAVHVGTSTAAHVGASTAVHVGTSAAARVGASTGIRCGPWHEHCTLDEEEPDLLSVRPRRRGPRALYAEAEAGDADMADAEGMGGQGSGGAGGGGGDGHGRQGHASGAEEGGGCDRGVGGSCGGWAWDRGGVIEPMGFSVPPSGYGLGLKVGVGWQWSWRMGIGPRPCSSWLAFQYHHRNMALG